MSVLCQNLKSRVHFVGIGTGKKAAGFQTNVPVHERRTPARGGRAGVDEGPP